MINGAIPRLPGTGLPLSKWGSNLGCQIRPRGCLKNGTRLCRRPAAAEEASIISRDFMACCGWSRTTQPRSICSKRALRFIDFWSPKLALLLSLLIAPMSAKVHAAALLLTGATVHTITGEDLSPGEVLLRDGKIAAIAKTISPEGATRVDLTGQHLYPGMISLDTVLGLTEIDAIRATADEKEVGDFTPDVQSWISVNPDSELIPVARANGISYFEPVPLGSIVSGQSGLLVVDGWTTEQLAVKTPVALHLFWPAMDLDTTPKERARGKTKPKSLADQAKERRTKVQSIAEFFAEAKAYAKAKAAAARGRAGPPEPVPAWEAMLPYIRG